MKSKILKQYLKLHPNVQDTSEAWYCDIYTDLADLIREYNQAQDYDPGIDFTEVENQPVSLSELLWKDFEYLSIYNPGLKDIENTISFAELLNQFPGASCIVKSKDEEINESLILISRPIIQSLHVFISSMEMLFRNSKVEHCLEKYDEVLLSKEFDDITLLIKSHRELKKRFIDRDYSTDNRLQYFDTPYDLCQRVRAARHFLLAHELAHILLAHQSKPRNPDYESSPALYDRLQEYEADRLACKILFAKFLDAKGNFRELNKTEEWELNNTCYGIRYLLFLFEYVYYFNDWEKEVPSVPIPEMRDVVCFQEIMSIYAKSENRDYDRQLQHGMYFTYLKRQYMIESKAIVPNYISRNGLLFEMMAFAHDRDILKMSNDQLMEKYKANKEILPLIEYTDYLESKIFYHPVKYYGLFKKIAVYEFEWWMYFQYNHFGLDLALTFFDHQCLAISPESDDKLREDLFRSDVTNIKNGLFLRQYGKVGPKSGEKVPCTIEEAYIALKKRDENRDKDQT